MDIDRGGTPLEGRIVRLSGTPYGCSPSVEVFTFQKLIGCMKREYSTRAMCRENRALPIPWVRVLCFVEFFILRACMKSTRLSCMM